MDAGRRIGMRPYSMDLRRRVVAACDRQDERRVKMAERFGVSTAWIRRLLQRRRETGSIAPLPQNPGRKLALDDRKMERLRRIVGRQPDATLRELKERLGIQLSDGAMMRALDRLRLTLKKSRSRPPSKSVTT
jgi:transposase